MLAAALLALLLIVGMVTAYRWGYVAGAAHASAAAHRAITAEHLASHEQRRAGRDYDADAKYPPAA